MTIEQLKLVIARTQIAGRSKFKTKVALLDAIKTFMKNNPSVTLRSLCGEDEDNDQGSTVEVMAEQHKIAEENAIEVQVGCSSDNVSVPVYAVCPVCECEESADMQCNTCQLQFCSALHGPHDSHSCQMLKNG